MVEKFPGLLRVARRLSLCEHLPPQQVRLGDEEYGVGALARDGRVREKCISLVVTAEHRGQTAERATDRTRRRQIRVKPLICKRRQPVEYRSCKQRIAAPDGGFCVGDHPLEPGRTNWKVEPGPGTFLNKRPNFVSGAPSGVGSA